MTNGASRARPPPETAFQCFHRCVVVCRTMCASSAMTTSNRSLDTLASRSHVVTHQRSPPSPKPAIERVQCGRSEEHTSELQSRQYLVCRLLIEKKESH